ncbi:opioid growth factor receptor [Thomomys bottae]
MDDLEWDSTWEDEDAEDGLAGAPDAGGADADADGDGLPAAQARVLQSRIPGSRNWRAMQDMYRYRHYYPDLEEQDCNGDMSNLSFYKNNIPFQPNGCVIENILQHWKDDYDILEDNHSYIQWLFPLREPGVNWHAKPLTLREVQEFKNSKEVTERLVRAYELMLGFYGIQLEDRSTGAVRRAPNYQLRFENLNSRSHNNLRITRILKSLGELGLERYQAPLVRFFLEETLVRNQLPGVRQSALDYFLFSVRCRRQRRELVHFAWEHFEPRCKFVWGPHDKLQRFRPHPASLPVETPEQAEEAHAQAQPCGPERDPRGEGGAAERLQPRSAEPQGVGIPEGGQEEEGEPLNPKENKKRKLEANRQEQALREPGPHSTADVEKIALNLEECALSPGSRAPGPDQAEQPCLPGQGAHVADEVRKRRKVERGPGGDAVADGAAGDAAGDVATVGDGCDTPSPTPPPAPPGVPEGTKSKSSEEGDAAGQGREEQSAPGSLSERQDPAAPRGSVGEAQEAAERGLTTPRKP